MMATAATVYLDFDMMCFTCIVALIPNANAIRPVPTPTNMLDRLTTFGRYHYVSTLPDKTYFENLRN
jgi:hypothetical protein